MRDTIVFDLDGTLIDSAPDLTHSLNAALDLTGAEAFDVETTKTMVGDGMVKLFERAAAASGQRFSGADFDGAYGAFERHYAENAVVDTVLYPGTREMLDALAGHGLTLAVCTNKLEPIARHILEVLGVADRFAVILGGRAGRPPKPDPAPLYEVLDALESEPGRAALIGDSKVDWGTARAAAIPFVLATFGYCHQATGIDADASIDAMSALPGALAGLQ
jgi:phosphoglycolate phosphatase